MIITKHIPKRLIALLTIISIFFSVMLTDVFAADSDFSKLNFDYKLAAPQEPSAFELYYSSENIVTSTDSSWTTHFDSSYMAASGDDACIIFKAPEGKKFKKFYCESYCLGTYTPDAYAYTDITDMSGEFKMYKTTNRLTAYQGSWYRANLLWGLIPENTKYIKLMLPKYESAGSWGRHITNIGFDVVDDSEKLYSNGPFMDDLKPDEDAGSMRDPYIYELFNAYWGGGGHQGASGSVGRDLIADQAYVTFQAPPGYKWKNFTLKTVNIVTERYTTDFRCSETEDGAYTMLPAPEPDLIDTTGNWGVYTYTFDTLPKNTRYIKVYLPAVSYNWAYQIDGFTTEFVELEDNIDEMKKSEYGYLNETAPMRPENGISSLSVNINDRECSYIYTNSRGERVIMAPQGRKISYFAYTAQKGNPGELYCSDGYTDGFKKSVVSEKSATNDCQVFEIDLSAADSGRAASSRETTYESSMLPAYSHYAKICGTSVSNIYVTFADESEKLTAYETASNFDYSNVFDDDPYIYSYSGMCQGYIRESVLYDSNKYSYSGSVVLKSGENNGEVVYGAPDNSCIKSFKFYIRNSGSKIVPEFYEIKKDGTTSETTAKITKMSEKLYEYSLAIGNDTIRVKAKIHAPDGDNTDKFKFVGYSFDWMGTPSDAKQAYKKYTLTINNNDTKQEIKGWGMFPSYSTENVLTKFGNDECKDLLFFDMGANNARVELYSEYDRDKKVLTGDNIQHLANQIKSFSNYGFDYIMTIWSPPGSLKTNGKAQGYNSDGSFAVLIENGEEEFCDYIILCLDTLVKLGCKKPISISFTNEAEGNAEWQACHFKTERYMKVCKMLSKKLDDSGYGDILIHGSEASALKESFTMFGSDFSAFDDMEFSDALDVFAYHGYGGINSTNMDDDTYKIALGKIGDRERWQTEYTSIDGWNDDYNVTESILKICRDTKLIGTSRWFWWNAYNSGLNDGIIRVKDGAYTQTSTYKMLKSIYNGAPVGSRACTYSLDDVQLLDKRAERYGNDIECKISTFKTPSGSAAIIINKSNCKKIYDIENIGGSEANLTIYDSDTDSVVSQTAEISNFALRNLEIMPGNIIVVSSVNTVPGIKYGFSFDEENKCASAKVKFENYNGSNLDIYLCAYKGSQLVDVGCVKAEISSEIQNADISVNYSGADRVELFVWKDKTLVPITEKISAFCPN